MLAPTQPTGKRADMNPADTEQRGDPTVLAGDSALAGGGSIDLDGDLVGAGLSGRDLTGVDLSGRDLTGADLSGADLSRCRLNGAVLRDAVLVHATLHETQLLGADLTGADLSGADAFSVMMGRANLTNAVLFNATLNDATFSHADLTNADFRTANLEGARFREAALIHTDLSRARMSGADLTRADVDRAIFRDTDLTGSRIKALTGYSSADWIGIDILGADFAGAYMVRRTIMDQNYLYEFKHKSRLNSIIYEIWSITSDCGRSFGRWGLLTALIAALFAIAYGFVDIDYGTYETALSPLYYSVVTMTTLGYGDAVPASAVGQVLAMIQVVLGYVMLGGVLSIFATKMARRAE